MNGRIEDPGLQLDGKMGEQGNLNDRVPRTLLAKNAGDVNPRLPKKNPRTLPGVVGIVDRYSFFSAGNSNASGFSSVVGPAIVIGKPLAPSLPLW